MEGSKDAHHHSLALGPMFTPIACAVSAKDYGGANRAFNVDVLERHAGVIHEYEPVGLVLSPSLQQPFGLRILVGPGNLWRAERREAPV